jgi:hypothetical protein
MQHRTIAALLATAVLSMTGIAAASAATSSGAHAAAGGASDVSDKSGVKSGAVTPDLAWSSFSSKLIVNKLSGKCLSVLGSGNGLAVTQLTCNSPGAQQHWTFSGGVLRNDETTDVLDVYGGGTADGQLVAAWGFWGGSMQYWYTVDKGGAYFELHNNATNKCLDLSGNNASDGADLQQWGCNWGANDNQTWFLA